MRRQAPFVHCFGETVHVIRECTSQKVLCEVLMALPSHFKPRPSLNVMPASFSQIKMASINKDVRQFAFNAEHNA